MELVQIRHFINIVECGSMTAASEKHHVSQSTLSYTVRQLENELGVRLFERSGRNIKLTGAGEMFYAGAVRLEEEHLELVRKVSSYGRELQPIRIVTDVVDYGTECCRLYKVVHPDADVQFRRIPSAAEMTDELAKGGIDLVISTSPFTGRVSRRGTELISEMILEEPLLIFVSGRHPFRQRESIALEDLKGQTLIMQPAAFEYRKTLDRILAGVEVEPAETLEYSDSETCALYAQSGRGVMFIPESVRGYQLQGDNPFNNDMAVTVKVTDDTCRRRIWISMRADKSEDNSVKAFIAFCRRYSAFIYEHKRLPADNEL